MQAPSAKGMKMDRWPEFRQNEHGGDGEKLVECHFDALRLEDQARAEVNHDEDQKGGQGAAFLVQVVFHFVSPLLDTAVEMRLLSSICIVFR